MFKTNLLKLTDSYKICHHKLFPPNTKKTYYYLESRGGQFNTTTFFGLQYLLREYIGGQAFDYDDILDAEETFKHHFGRADVFNKDGWLYILNQYGGRLPLKIKAVKEGTTVDTGNVLLTVENTDDKCWWLPGYIETLIVQLWSPITVCTLSREIKKIIKEYHDLTSDETNIDFKLHDFGFRGVSSIETAAIAGAAHLVNFKGTDTLPAIDLIKLYYGEKCAGFSIPATEHSNITSWGKDKELDAYRNLLTQFPNGLIACVSDSYNIYNACNNLWGKELKDRVLNREGCLVIRPDSGDPVSMSIQCLEMLGKFFGYSYNSKGYKVLNPKVRVIYGDGINLNTIQLILLSMHTIGWSADNMTFGCGGALLQKINRDTQSFAYKCSAIQINDKWQDVYKDPISSGNKKSKRGRLDLIKYNTGNYVTTPENIHNEDKNELHTIFDNGCLNNQLFNDIRERANLCV